MDTEIEKRPSPRGSAVPWLLFLLTAAGLGAVVYFGWGLMQSERTRADSTAKQLSDVNVKVAELDATRRALEEKVKTLETDKASLSAKTDELSEDLQEAEAELARLKATYDSLEEKMQAEIKKGEIKLTQGEGRIKVDLVDKVLFDSGQAELSPRGVEVLTRLGGVLASIDDKLIQVAGHTDDSPIVNELKTKYATNWELSAARAVNVVRFLAEKGNVNAKRLVAAGHGEFQPVATNATPAGRAANRRIEILLLPTLTKQKGAPQVAAAAGTRAAAAVPAKASAPKPATKSSLLERRAGLKPLKQAPAPATTRKKK